MLHLFSGLLGKVLVGRDKPKSRLKLRQSISQVNPKGQVQIKSSVSVMLHLFSTFIGQVQVKSQVLSKQVSGPKEQIQVKSQVFIRLF